VPSFDVVPTCVLGEADQTVREAHKNALTTAGITVTDEAGDAATVLAVAAERRPSLVIVDADLPGGGLMTARMLNRTVTGAAVVVLAATTTEDQLFEALSLGAVGYLSKDIAPVRLASAVLAVLEGEVALTRSMMARVVEELQGRPGRRVPMRSAPVTKLTSREWDVANLMRAGASTGQIAARLYMSSSTVRVHVSNILHKLQVADRAAAIRVLAGI
jgi:DNA-binding NarL/FixJ family response regulator